jgi:hypothetical protein
MLAGLFYVIGLLDFHGTSKFFFGVRLKQSSFWPSADVKPMPNYLVHAMPQQCMCALCMCIRWRGGSYTRSFVYAEVRIRGGSYTVYKLVY